jgi:hypothetical protein
MKNLENITNNQRDEDLKLLFYSVLVGIVAGGFSSLYRYIIHGIEGVLGVIINYSREYLYIYPLLFVALIFISFLVSKLKKMSKFCGGSGIPQVEAEIKGYINPNPEKLLFAKIVGGGLTALSGFSVGREGPSIQIGAMSGKIVSKKLKKNKTIEKFLITCGASAGLAAAFNAPVAGILFAVEEIHRHISKKLLVVCMASTITADLVSKILYGIDTVFSFKLSDKLPITDYWTLILFSIALSLLGVLYIFLMEFFMKVQDRIKLKQEFKLIPYFVLPLFILAFMPNLLGGGGFLMKELQTVDFPIYMLILLFIVKLLFSIICFSSGVPGGIFFPILVLGATIGTIFGKIIDPVYINSFIILGMAGYLTAIVRAPITSIILIFEMTGNLSYLLPLSIVCLITYSVPNYLKSLPIYEYLLERLMEKEHISTSKCGEKMTMSIVVELGSEIENKKIKEVNFPDGMLITNIDRGIEEIIPNGETVIINGDVIKILVNENKLFETFTELQKICQNN